MRDSVFLLKLSLMKVCLFLLLPYSFGDDTVTYRVLHGFQNGDKFECATNVTLQCELKNVIESLDWFIGTSLKAAICSNVSLNCQKNPSVTSPYTFTFDSHRKHSNLTITPVTTSDDNVQFFCNDGFTKSVFQASVIVPPRYGSAVNGTTRHPNETEYKITTSCIYPANRTKFAWYSPAADGYEHKRHNETKRITTQCQPATNNCIFPNKSEDVSSVLMISNLPVGQFGRPRNVEVQVLYDDKPLFNMTVGTFLEADKDECTSSPCQNNGTCIDKVNGYNCSCLQGYEGPNCETDITTDITTVTTNNSPSKTSVTASSVAKSSTSEIKMTTATSYANPNTSSPTTKTNTTSISTLSTATPSSSSTGTSSAIPGKQQKQNADKTSTILIIAFSSIAGISLLLLVVFALNKIRKRHTKQSGASSTLEMKPDPNNQ